MDGPFHGKTRQQPTASRRLVARAFRRRTLVARCVVSGRFVVTLCVSPAARASAPSRHSDRWTQGACRRTGETVCSHRSDDVDSVFIPCFAKRAAGCFPVFSATAFFEQNCRTAMEGGLWPPANWAAAEPDVAGLGSEAMATLCVEQLQLLLQHYESNESSLVQRSRSVGGLPGSHRRPCRVSAVPAWPTMY